MSGDKILLVNANYERQLSLHEKSVVWTKPCAEIEYLFFYLKSGTYFSKVIYEERFLSKFSRIKIINNLTKKVELIPLWGNFKYYKLKTSLSSKIISHQKLSALLKNFYPNFSFEIVNEISEKDLKSFIYRADYGFSGRSLTSRGFVKTEKFLRKIDLSFIWINGLKGVYQNIVSEKGQYKGTFLNPSLFQMNREDFLAQYGLGKSEIDNFMNFISNLEQEFLNDYIDTGEPLTLDFFLYSGDDKLKIFPFCEFNTRNTMGLIAHQLYNDLMEQKENLMEYNFFFFLERSKANSIKDAYHLSPKNTHFSCGFSYREKESVVHNPEQIRRMK